MSNETYISIIGTMVGDPELRFLPNGTGVANFTVAVNARKFNRDKNEWEKKPAKFWRCQAWNSGKALLAENVANVLKKGDTVVVYGELETREYEKDGQKRSADELRVEGIGKDLRWHQAYANDVPAQQDPWANRPANVGGDPVGQGGVSAGWGNGPSGADNSPPF